MIEYRTSQISETEYLLLKMKDDKIIKTERKRYVETIQYRMEIESKNGWKYLHSDNSINNLELWRIKRGIKKKVTRIIDIHKNARVR